MKQTAVEHFLNAIKNQISLSKEHLEMIESYAKQAKEMEKEQSIAFAQEVFRNRYNEVHQSLTKVATDTYNETYGGGK
jgi:hypothetical protein